LNENENEMENIRQLHESTAKKRVLQGKREKSIFRKKLYLIQLDSTQPLGRLL